MNRNLKLTYFVLFTFSALFLHAESPVDVVKKVADRIIDESTFEFYSKPQEADERLQVVNLPKSKTDKTVYALSKIQSEEAGNFTFGISSTGPVEIWINDKKVFEGQNLEGFEDVAYDMYKFPVQYNTDLVEGENTVLIKAVSGKNKFFVMGAVDNIGMIKEGIKFELPISSEGQSAYHKWMMLGPLETECSLSNEIQSNYKIDGKYYTWYIPETSIVLDDVIEKNFTFRKHSYFEWHYANGQMLFAMLALADLTKDEKYYNHVKKFCDFTLDNYDYFKYQYEVLNERTGFNYRLYRRIMLDDTGAPSFPLLELYMRNQLDDSKFLIDSIAAFISTGQSRLADGTLCRLEPREWTVWADDLFMSSPFLLRYAKLTGEDKYYDDAANQILLFNDKLFDPELNIYYHGWFSDTKENTAVHWGRANGWIIWAVTEALMYLPEDHKDYNKILAIYKKYIDSIIKYQDASGMWHQVVDHPESYEETSSSAMFVLSIARGITNGWIDESYKENVIKGWNAIAAKISNDGIVQGICRGTGIGDDLEFYFTRETPPNDPRGLGAVLNAGVEVQKLLNQFGE